MNNNKLTMMKMKKTKIIKQEKWKSQMMILMKKKRMNPKDKIVKKRKSDLVIIKYNLNSVS